MNKYSTEEKQQAIDLYFKNGCNMKKHWCQTPGTKYNLYLQLLEMDMLSTIEQMQEGEKYRVPDPWY